MAEHERLVTAGRVGRPHGLDGSFAVLEPDHELAIGTTVVVAGSSHAVERRAGTDARPLVRLSGVDDREAAAALSGKPLLLSLQREPLADGEWFSADLVGCEVEGVGTVQGVIAGPSCDVLELDGGQLIPLIGDAVRSVDVEARRIEVDRRFLGLEADPGPDAGSAR